MTWNYSTMVSKFTMYTTKEQLQCALKYNIRCAVLTEEWICQSIIFSCSILLTWRKYSSFYGLPPCQAPKEIGLFKIQYIERGGGGSSKALSCLKSACDLTENLMLDKELRLLKRHGLWYTVCSQLCLFFLTCDFLLKRCWILFYSDDFFCPYGMKLTLP